MTGYDYEYTVAAYLRHKGYSRVKVTQGSGDYGIDVLASKGNVKYAVQCKYYSNPVGVKAVQEAVAGVAYYGCNRAMVVTNNTFTPQAKKLAAANNVVLMENVVGVPKSRKSIFRILFVVAICFVYFLWYYMMFNIISVRINDPSVTTSFKEVVELALMFIFPIGVPILCIILKKRIKSGKYKYKHIYFVESNTGNEDKIYQQRDKSDYTLDNSKITGLPHRFSIMGESFDIDKVEDIVNMPLNFSSFSVSGTRYYFNNYFRLCAKLYQKAGYKDNAKALRKKARELELDPQHGKYIRGKAKTFIRLPKESEVVEEVELGYEEQDEQPTYQINSAENNDYPLIDIEKVALGIQATQSERQVLGLLTLQKKSPVIPMLQMVSGQDFVYARDMFNRLVENGYVDRETRQWTIKAYK